MLRAAALTQAGLWSVAGVKCADVCGSLAAVVQGRIIVSCFYLPLTNARFLLTLCVARAPCPRAPHGSSRAQWPAAVLGARLTN